MHGLGDLETAIMDRMWSRQRPASVRDVFEDLRRDRTIAYTTVMTVMDKLYKKGLLCRHPEGRAYLYEPALTHEAYTAQIMRDAFAHGGNQAVTLVHFLERLTPNEQAALGTALKVINQPGHQK
ncbi:BlaI/MecI/CopY family transcriptional regulator [Streptosporangium sp. NPDC002544]|uniref:BlaI/MecI/CopY family transcriptional regulator n=1 Tax=unclassified Streptosporangium TaxID=2632669 RepID=UPI003330510B